MSWFRILTENGFQNMHLIKICNIWFQKQNVSKEAPKKIKIRRQGYILKSHDNESKSTPDYQTNKTCWYSSNWYFNASIRKLHKSKDLDEAGKDINKTITVKIRDLAITIQNWLNIHIHQNIWKACPKEEKN